MKAFNTVSIAFAALVFAGLAHAGNVSVISSEATEAAIARQNWREAMAKQTVPTKGCFHVVYPSYLWESVPCGAPTVPGSRSIPSQGVTEAPGRAAGDSMGDYVVQARGGGLVTYADGTFNGESSEISGASVATANGEGIDDPESLGAGKYTLQLNTNATKAGDNPLRCQQNPHHTADCRIWQQFIYSSDSHVATGQDRGAVFMQYWLFNWGDNPLTSCPTNGTWNRDVRPNGHLNCWRNSEQVTEMPAVPLSELTEAKLAGSLMIGNDGTMYDVAIMDYGNEAWAATEEDRTLYISDVWDQVEFNIVGNLNYSNAQFSDGTVLDVTVNLRDGSTMQPACISDLGSGVGGITGETNNLVLASCITSKNSGGYPTATFYEGTSYPAIASFVDSLEKPQPIIITHPISGLGAQL